MKQKKHGNKKSKQAIMNEKITCKEVRLIDENGEQVGVVSTSEALLRAKNIGIDLVLISPNADIPVAKIIDYGKYNYELQKKKKEQKANQKKVILKEIRLSPTIDKHDYDTKINNAKKFLEKGYKVQFSIRFKGRMITHSEFGRDVMERVMSDLENETTVDQRPKMEGRKMFLVVSPLSKK